MSDLHLQSALEIGRQIAARRLTSRQVSEYFLERIDRAGVLNAFTVVLARQALAQADAADAMLRSAQRLSPLHGVPIAIKDNFEIAGVPTCAGSLTRKGVTSDIDSTVVTRLISAGMVLLGKTHMTEFAFGLSGQNPLAGTPWNPWNIREAHAPGGSSSGSAVAVAAGLAPIALGSDSGGSVRAPAALNNLIGFKPSRGMISGAGVVPLAPSLDAPGILSRTVEDARTLARIVGEPDSAAPNGDAASASLWHEPYDGSRHAYRETFVLHADAFPAALGSDAARVWDTALAKLHDGGWRLTEWRPTEGLEIHSLSHDNSVLMAYEAFALYGALAHDPLQPLWEVVRQRIMAGATIGEREYAGAKARRSAAAAAFARAVGADGTLLMPVSSHAALPLDTTDIAHASIGAFCRAGNFLDTTAIALPAGFDEAGMPIGVQLMAPRFADKLLLSRAEKMAELLRVDDRQPELSHWGL